MLKGSMLPILRKSIAFIDEIHYFCISFFPLCLSSSRLSEESNGAYGHHICEERERKGPGPPGGLVYR